MDIQRVVTGVVSLASGIIILVKLLSIGFNPIALITGLAFLGFGIYRLNIAVHRYQEYRQKKQGSDQRD